MKEPEPYKVLALKYRPRTFDDLVGQLKVSSTLAGAMESGRIHHAYLLTGSRGVGKTTTARIIAKAMNCEKGPTATPCLECAICKGIEDGNDVDVLEIDGASNTGVDNIRDLKEKAYLRPTRARFKIYIIDEVHMLTKAAFNALLKLLEEPPKHVKFIFATTEPHKVISTIVSRCLRFDFERITNSAIVDRLSHICKVEGLGAEPDALRMIALASKGGMRDALSMLDQVVSGAKDRIDTLVVADTIGIIGPEVVKEIVANLYAGNSAEVLRIIDRAEREGRDIPLLLESLIEMFQNLLRVAVAGSEYPLIDETDEMKGWLVQHSRGVPTEIFLMSLEILMEGKARVRETDMPKAALEIALVKISRIKGLIPLTEVLVKLQRLEARLEKSIGLPRPVNPVSFEEAVKLIDSGRTSAKKKSDLAPRMNEQSDDDDWNDSEGVEGPDAGFEETGRGRPDDDSGARDESSEFMADADAREQAESSAEAERAEMRIDDVQRAWDRILAKVEADHGEGVKHTLSSVVPVSVESGQLVVAFREGTRGFIRDVFKSTSCDAKLEAACASVLGSKSLRVRVAAETAADLGPAIPQTVQREASDEGAQSLVEPMVLAAVSEDGVPEAPAEDVGKPRKKASKKRAGKVSEHPNFRRAQEIFDGSLDEEQGGK
ncbi:MAG: DNA polymerase III subunit gamma/tau [Planctomycetes bacterium]|nr:DNA polymerase III subunit gamma/tau [Planctomycetota bacterium]